MPRRHNQPRMPPASPTSSGPSFSNMIAERARAQRSSLVSLRGEELAALDYQAELALKDAALAQFWRQARLAGRPEPVVASPRPRGYRTTSKRRVELVGRLPYLFLGERRARKGSPPFVPSPLEPDEHAAIYRFLQTRLTQPANRLVAEHLNWLIIRGAYAERAVIFNVDELFAPLVRKLKMLAEDLAANGPGVVAAAAYVGRDSDYYLDSRQGMGTVGFKHLFGPRLLRVNYGELRFSFHPTSFSQVNESIVPRMLALAAELLEPRADECLLDLFCGYGLFSIALADRVRDVIGVDADRASIEMAEANAARLLRGRTRFIATAITAESIEHLRRPSGGESIVLDPPRNGTDRGLIAVLGRRQPRRVLHIFCNVDEIPRSLAEWADAGYAPQRIVPLDMFPGTANLEVIVQLEAVLPRSVASRHVR